MTRPSAFEPANGPGGTSFGDLPEWDLSDLYVRPRCAAYVADLSSVRAEALSFATDYEGKLEALSGDDIAGAMGRYERLSGKIGRVMSYAGLR